jgi:hypothetical protein
MALFYSNNSNWRLSQDDIDGIRSLYGAGSSASTLAPPVTSSTTATIQTTVNPSTLFCNEDSIDAISLDDYQRLFVFKGAYFIMKDRNGDVAPRLIQSVYPELSETVDAAVYVPTLYRRYCYASGGYYYCEYELAEQAAFYVFKGEYYYEYSSGVFDSRYYQGKGKITTKFGAGIESNLDSVFSIYGIHLHFTKGNNVWRTTRAKSVPIVDNNFPMALSAFVTGLPTTGVKAAFNARNDSGSYAVYFFNGNQYYTTTATDYSTTVVGPPGQVNVDLFNCNSANNLINNKGNKKDSSRDKGIKFTNQQNSGSEEVYMDENENFVKRGERKKQCSNNTS